MANIKPSRKKKKKGYNFQFSLSSLLLLSITFLFILGWVFSLGIMVGRGFLPKTIGTFSAVKEKTARVEEKTARVEEKKKNDQLKPIKEEELIFYNQLVDKKNRAKKKSLSEALLKEQDRTPKKRKAEQSKKDAGNYNVQVAAAKDKGKIEKLVKRLTSLGYPAYYNQTLINEEIYYRARCGPFPDIEEAKKCRKRLADKEGFKPFIIYPSKIE